MKSDLIRPEIDSRPASGVRLKEQLSYAGIARPSMSGLVNDRGVASLCYTTGIRASCQGLGCGSSVAVAPVRGALAPR
jgi:hypothetical protein